MPSGVAQQDDHGFGQLIGSEQFVGTRRIFDHNARYRSYPNPVLSLASVEEVVFSHGVVH